MSRKSTIQIKDIYRFKIPAEPAVSPDGKQIVFTVERMDKKDQAYYKNIYLINTNGRHQKQLTFGKRNDQSPMWSPDGQWIAFIRKQDTAYQIWLLPKKGGEAKPLTKLPRGSISYFRWSPEGKRILFLFHPLSKEAQVDKNGKISTPVYRHIKDIWYRLDGEGFFDSENTHIWLANAKSGATKQLVFGDFEDANPCWSPDGKEIAFITSREKDWRHRLEEQDIYRVSIESGTLKKLKTPAGPKGGGLSYSPNGKTIAYIGHDRPYKGWGVINFILNTVSLSGKNHRQYRDVFDRTAIMLTIGDITPSFVMTPPLWSRDGQSIYYGISSNGRQHILKHQL